MNRIVRSAVAVGWMSALAVLSVGVAVGGDDKPARPEQGRCGAECERPKAEAHKGAKDRIAAARGEIERRVGEMKAREAKLREAGRTEEADRVHEEAVQFVAHADKRMEAMKKDLIRAEGGDGKAEVRKHEPMRPELAEGKRRLMHLRAAAENLKAAGMDDAAHRVMQEAERMEQDLRKEADRKDASRDVPPEGVEHIRELGKTVRELRAEVERLQGQVRELKARQP